MDWKVRYRVKEFEEGKFVVQWKYKLLPFWLYDLSPGPGAGYFYNEWETKREAFARMKKLKKETGRINKYYEEQF